jgi:nickel/cobalt transporter (NicO) family protein
MKHRFPASILLVSAAIWAHPMGNFSVSHYSRIEMTARGANVRYVLHLAEIPTVQLLQQWKLEAGSPREDLERRAADQARDWARNLRIRSGGNEVTPRVAHTAISIDKSVSGMPVMRIQTDLVVDVAPGVLTYEDGNFPDRAGWKEIVIVAGENAAIEKATPSGSDRSQALTVYPQDGIAASPQDVRASIEWRSTSQAISESARVREHEDYLAGMLHQGDTSFGMVLMGMAVAFGLGAIHALSPGHGKTIVAAYLVGSRGTPKHAIFLGGMVTFTHTISVFFLGFVTWYLSQYVLPEKIYPVLGTISGLSIVWIGSTLFLKRLSAAKRGQQHHSNPLVHDHGDGHVHSHVPEGDISMGSLIALGASGGLVPCPSALVLLLSSVALGRIALGMTLLVAFSAGLAMVLMAIGLIVLYAKHLLPDSQTTARNPFFRYVPVASAAVITCAGLLMTAAALGVIRPLPGV